MVCRSRAAGIHGQRYDGSGRPVGAEFQVSDSGARYAPVSAAMDRVGNLVVTWHDPEGVTARRFDRGGAPLGSGFRVTGDGYHGHHVAKSANGNFVVVWADYFADVSAELYARDGAVLRSHFPLEAPEGFPASWGPVAAMDRNGGFVAVWTRDGGGVSGADIIVQRFDSLGSPLGGDFRSIPTRPAASTGPRWR